MMRLGRSFPPVLVMTARLRNTLLPWYSRRHAEDYERRRQGKRWKAERRVFLQLYERVEPRNVLDCPVGTGRWFEIYQQHDTMVTGIDLSRDMLVQAARRIGPRARIALKRSDLLANGALGTGYDLIVCTRFAHWLRLRDLMQLAARFSATGARHLILGARVWKTVHTRHGWLERLRHVATFSHVHDEEHMLSCLREQGWRLLERARIGRGGRWIYYFYLFGRSDQS